MQQYSTCEEYSKQNGGKIQHIYNICNYLEYRLTQLENELERKMQERLDQFEIKIDSNFAENKQYLQTQLRAVHSQLETQKMQQDAFVQSISEQMAAADRRQQEISETVRTYYLEVQVFQQQCSDRVVQIQDRVRYDGAKLESIVKSCEMKVNQDEQLVSQL